MPQRPGSVTFVAVLAYINGILSIIGGVVMTRSPRNAAWGKWRSGSGIGTKDWVCARAGAKKSPRVATSAMTTGVKRRGRLGQRFMVGSRGWFYKGCRDSIVW